MSLLGTNQTLLTQQLIQWYFLLWAQLLNHPDIGHFEHMRILINHIKTIPFELSFNLLIISLPAREDKDWVSVWLNWLIWEDLLLKKMDLGDECGLIDLIWEDGWRGICKMTSSIMCRDLKGRNLKLPNSPHKWGENYEISL